MTDQKSCEERIEEQMERTMKSLRDPEDAPRQCCTCWHDDWYAEDGNKVCPECGSEDTEVDRIGLVNDQFIELTKLHVVYRAGLSWGGPADGFYLYVDPEDNTIDKVEYYFQDWFDGALKELQGEDLEALKTLFSEYVSMGYHARS